MGAAALTLSGGEYAIHGTNKPGSIGGFVSYGCIRMYNADVLDLYSRVGFGHDGGRHPLTRSAIARRRTAGAEVLDRPPVHRSLARPADAHIERTLPAMADMRGLEIRSRRRGIPAA